MGSALVKEHNENVLRELKEGDLVEFCKGPYSHWGVYIGDNEIVHLTDGNNDRAQVSSDVTKHVFSSGVMNAKVLKENFWVVANKSKAKINNKKDKKWKPVSPDKIVERAKSKIGDMEYRLLFNNCEHFATYCRYNVKISGQAKTFQAGANSAKAAANTVTAIGSIAMFILEILK